MPFEHLVGGVAAAGLMLSATGFYVDAHRVLWVPLCQGGSLPISLPIDGSAPSKHVPAGCHAACFARREDRAETRE